MGHSHSETDETTKSTRQRTTRDEETNSLGKITLGVPERQVKSHGLTEKCLSDTDHQTTGVETSGVGDSRLACGGNRPEKSSCGNGSVGRDGFGEKGTGNLDLRQVVCVGI